MTTNDTVELSIQEQMYIYSKNYSKMFPRAAGLFVVILVLSLGIFQNMNLNNLLFDPLSEYLILYTIVIAGISGSAILWFIINGKKQHSKLKDVLRKYTNDSYFLALGLTSHKNDKNIIGDFYEMCLSVFPELKKADKESLKETDEVLELEELTLEIEDKDYLLTVVTVSNKKFIIKYFGQTNVDYDQLKEYVKIVNKEFGPDIFRVVCLARNFDSKILKKYETLQYDIPVDLIIVTDNGFSGLKISDYVN